MTATLWNPSTLLALGDGKSEETFGVVILNQPIGDDAELFGRIWRNAAVRVCADGGSNRLYDHDSNYVPDYITGDLDSIRPEVRQHYQQNHNIPVVEDGDQYATDFGKSIKLIQKLPEKERPQSIVALPAFGGRVDQSIHAIQTLYECAQQGIRLYLLSSENVTFLLEPGPNKIVLDKQLLGPACGVMPVGEPVRCTTSGLRWNLEGEEMRFGGLVSTSNLVDGDVVEVETDKRVLWTVEFRKTQI
ncbi:Thiamin pyrophosphokinase [Saitoella complicata NRRL Y-17804]|uniref:Thiamin pyrophosphokinase n=1 Tax=Saitoella complicata (strain BCRC 22490 / CBS 7301 / JCM 7358 / NBRC 10748 / NRRL Y-17804) TaxID=698492 RepID=UPI000867B243|nr:Thiamin pyrophosphokinase [Saitoella complicata NRRL Y-17804]ODQ55286.1 Thiamin pyrophosphokinase [Saitoella complicata NRRL Y-17804]